MLTWLVAIPHTASNVIDSPLPQPLQDLMLKPAGPWMGPYFHLSIQWEGTFPLTRSGHRSAGRIFRLQYFHAVCFHYGRAEAGRRRVSAAGPQEWVLEPFFRSALQRLRFWDNWSHVSWSIEAAISILKYSDRSEIEHTILRLCCWPACQISKQLENNINLPASTFHGILG